MEALFDTVGGQPFFDQLVDRFYDRVETDEVMRAMYPEDLTDPKRHLALFLGQFWGGPNAYMDLRGHPRLRKRHVPFVIDQVARDTWLAFMAASVRESDADESVKQTMINYFEQSATFLMNA